MRTRYAVQTFVAIAQAETTMYLSVAEQFAEEGEGEMCAAILDWAAKAVSDKAKLAAAR